MQDDFDALDVFIDSLGIPEVCHLNQKLFKKQFYTLAKLNRASQEQFAKEVSAIVWTHALKKGTINIAPLVTEKLEYIEVAYIHVTLESKRHFKKIAEVIHRIPYPVVLMLSYQSELCISTALKHINQADVSKMTVNAYLYSAWIGLTQPSVPQQEFLESLRLKYLSFENFYTFYSDICNRIVALDISTLGGVFSTDDASKKKPILDKIKKLNEQILSLRAAIKKETAFNAKVRLNMQIKKLEDEINACKEIL